MALGENISDLGCCKHATRCCTTLLPSSGKVNKLNKLDQLEMEIKKSPGARSRQQNEYTSKFYHMYFFFVYSPEGGLDQEAL
jgi:hypothetical protein